MNFIKNLKSVFSKLGFVDKAKSSSMTAEDWTAVRNAYKEEFGVEFSADQAAYNADQLQAEQSQQQAQRLEQENSDALTMINEALRDESMGGSDSGTPQGANSAPVTNQDTSLLGGVMSLVREVQTMRGSMIPETPRKVSGVTLSTNGPGHSDQYFCGIEHPVFSMDRRYNKVGRNPGYATLHPASEKSDGPEFRKELSGYSTLLSSRINELRAMNSLNLGALKQDFNLNVNSDGLGNQYLTRRMDEIIVRLLSVKNVYDIFPRRFGVQDREVMYNAFMGDFSQAYQKGGIWKGNIDLKPEIAYVDDAMFKTLFDSMKDLERKYIGYLNKDGSDPIKWSMIEWAMLQISTKLIEEQNRRKIMGVYIHPEPGKAGHALNAGTGVYYTLLRYYNENKISLVDDSAYSAYTSGETMVACVVNMLQMLAEGVDELDKYEVILNANHRAKWLAGIREIYGKDTDFTGPNGDEVPDLRNVIRWCPYMGQLPLILVQQPGNIQCIEFEAGEMHAISFLPDMEAVKAWAVWKEGTSAEFSGKPAESKAAKKASGYGDQVIFMNRPSAVVATDATTVTASGDMRHYITGANTEAKALTDIVGAKSGFAYIIEVGDAAHPQSIAKTGKFSGISKAYAPSQVGDYIMMAIDSDGTKFVELERCEAGVRVINTLVQPNVPGGR